jgi:hypothetical protein
MGANALHSTTSKSNLVAIGDSSLYNNSIGATLTGQGTNNTAIGSKTLYANTTGSHNTAAGYQVLYHNNTGVANTAFGSGALFSNTQGYLNTAHGFRTLNLNTTGIGNTGFGSEALYLNTSGNHNTAIGTRALVNNLTGSNNTAIGDSAGYNSTGNKNIFLGYSAGFYENSGSNKLYIANDSNRTLMYGDFSTGQVLLGKGQPTGYVFKGTRTLNVLGGLLVDSVRVALSATWSDYVFNDDYPLMPLNELQQFISKNKHLPGIPTANEVKAEGIELGGMNAKLLAKIEELHLYILQQQRLHESQMNINTDHKKLIHTMQNMIMEQQKQIDELKKMINNKN